MRLWMGLSLSLSLSLSLRWPCTVDGTVESTILTNSPVSLARTLCDALFGRSALCECREGPCGVNEKGSIMWSMRCEKWNSVCVSSLYRLISDGTTNKSDNYYTANRLRIFTAMQCNDLDTQTQKHFLSKHFLLSFLLLLLLLLLLLRLDAMCEYTELRCSQRVRWSACLWIFDSALNTHWAYVYI